MLTNNSLLKRDSFLLCCRNMLIRELAAVWVAVLLCHLQLTGSQVSGRLLFRYGFSMTSRPALFRVLLSTRNFFSFSPSKSGRKFTVPIFETRSYSSFYSSSIRGSDCFDSGFSLQSRIFRWNSDLWNFMMMTVFSRQISRIILTREMKWTIVECGENLPMKRSHKGINKNWRIYSTSIFKFLKVQSNTEIVSNTRRVSWRDTIRELFVDTRRDNRDTENMISMRKKEEERGFSPRILLEKLSQGLRSNWRGPRESPPVAWPFARDVECVACVRGESEFQPACRQAYTRVPYSTGNQSYQPLQYFSIYKKCQRERSFFFFFFF